MTAVRRVLVALWDVPRGCRDSRTRRADVASALADYARDIGLIQVDPVVIGYVDDEPSPLGAIQAAAASAGVDVATGDLYAFAQSTGQRVHVGVCPVVDPIAVTAVDPAAGMSPRLRELLESGQRAAWIANRTRTTVERVDTLRAALRLPYQSPRTTANGRVLQAAGSR
ncbi:hypothetical protein [Glycomyces sp. YM15]|uniref:hypothetical protein n=1 Tax=Glycomyces sp. YM15 TaxID=2800446 RepID=UPI00196479C5|nr:hypothetical protein [Glycomyces sp. YM15]